MGGNPFVVERGSCCSLRQFCYKIHDLYRHDQALSSASECLNGERRAMSAAPTEFFRASSQISASMPSSSMLISKDFFAVMINFPLTVSLA